MKEKIKVFLCYSILFLSTPTLSAQTEISIVDRMTKYNLFNNLKPKSMAEEVKQDSEFEPNIFGVRTDIPDNPLLINGKTLDYNNFMIGSKGELTVVKGKPETSKATPIAFYVQIRRDGVILEDSKMPFLHKQLYKIDLSKIFPFCKDGDRLIIKPVKLENWKAKRILKLVDGC